jgi:hypothetical protein
MNEFRIRATGAVVSEVELRSMYNKILPDLIDVAVANENGIDPVLHAPEPPYTELQVVHRNGVVQDELGNWVQAYVVLPKFATEVEEAAHTAQLLDDRRRALSERIAQRRVDEQGKGYTYLFPDGLTGVVQTRQDSPDLLNINGQVTAALVLQSQGVLDPVMNFRDEENVTHQMTPTQMIVMGLTVSQFVSATYSSKWYHDEAVKAWDGSVEYDYTVGWPT